MKIIVEIDSPHPVYPVMFATKFLDDLIGILLDQIPPSVEDKKKYPKEIDHTGDFTEAKVKFIKTRTSYEL